MRLAVAVILIKLNYCDSVLAGLPWLTVKLYGREPRTPQLNLFWTCSDVTTLVRYRWNCIGRYSTLRH